MTNNYVSGATRKLSNYINQYQTMMNQHNITDINEFNFEEEEEKYHIMKVFEQALNSARSKGGVVDEGNQIYFTQIGINGTSALFYINQYLATENELIKERKEPTYNMQLLFLENMSNKFKGCSKVLTEYKGMNITTKEAMINGN
jgi:hypothetical protein